MIHLLEFILVLAMMAVAIGYLIVGIEITRAALRATARNRTMTAGAMYFTASAFIIAAGFVISLATRIISNQPIY